MDLSRFAEHAWDAAEAKGLHANLDGVTALGAREQALLALIPLSLTLNTVIQTIKRNGVSMQVWDACLYDLEHTLVHGIEDTFDILLDLCGGQVPPLQVPPGDTTAATGIRLLLMGTEVVEALEANALTPTDTHAIGREAMDVVVRAGDLIHGLGHDMNALADEVLTANTQRPYQYGTDLEAKMHEDR